MSGYFKSYATLRIAIQYMSMPGQLRVILKSDGCLESIKKEAVAWTMIIPCTEESMGRTSKPVPHPLCDQLQYVDKVCDAKRTCMYLNEIKMETKHPSNEPLI